MLHKHSVKWSVLDINLETRTVQNRNRSFGPQCPLRMVMASCPLPVDNPYYPTISKCLLKSFLNTTIISASITNTGSTFQHPSLCVTKPTTLNFLSLIHLFHLYTPHPTPPQSKQVVKALHQNPPTCNSDSTKKLYLPFKFI